FMILHDKGVVVQPRRQACQQMGRPALYRIHVSPPFLLIELTTNRYCMPDLTASRLALGVAMLHACADFPSTGRGDSLKVSAMIRLSPGVEPHTQLLGQMAEYARRIEKRGFPGIWVGDSMGRGRPTLDPLTALAALAAVTERVELGIGVLQGALPHPIEAAHRGRAGSARSGGGPGPCFGRGSTPGD